MKNYSKKENIETETKKEMNERGKKEEEIKQ